MFDALKKTFSSLIEKVKGKGKPKDKGGEKKKVEEVKVEKKPKQKIIEKEGKEKRGKKKKAVEKRQKEKTKKAEKKKPRAKIGIGKSIISLISNKITLDEKDISDALDEFELQLIEGDVALDVAEEIKERLKERLVGKEIERSKVDETIKNEMENILNEIMAEPFDVVELIKTSKSKPFIIAFFGPNGSGKTTTIAKFANLLLKNNLSVVIAAADTFRAAAIEQLKEHGKRLGVNVISSTYGADPTSVAYDAVNHAKSKNIDVVLIDTAGRQSINQNLMKELEKLVRVIKPNLKIYIGESVSGNGLYEQVKEYNEIVGIDGIILTKADLDPKGGTAISASKATGVPIIYITYGQGYEAIKPFKKEEIIENVLG